MDHLTMMECGDHFALCDSCNNITVFSFTNCHKCKTHIDKKKYKQECSMDKYDLMIKALINFEIDIIEDCHSMVSISREKDDSVAPELHQILKINNEYTYIHFEKDTHKQIAKEIVKPETFVPKLDRDEKYKVDLIYGPYGIFVHQ